jgi:hypothetical protein
MPPRRRLAQYLEEQTLRADEEVKRKVEDIERRLREEEAVVDADVDRKTKLYVVRKKFLDEIAGELATVQEKYQKAIIQKEIDNLSKLRDAYMELGDKVQQKMKIYEASVLAAASATKNIGKHLASRAEQQLKAYMQQKDEGEAVESEDERNAEKQQRIDEMQENVTFSLTKSRDFKRKAEQTSSPKESKWFMTLSLAYGAEAVRTKHEIQELGSEEKVMVWNADRQDVKRWIEEYWARCHRAVVKDKQLFVLIKERLMLMHIKDEMLAMNTGSGERTLEMNEELRTITKHLKESDERIDDFGDTGVAAGGDGDQVIVRAPDIIERKARSIMMRFALLFLTRKEHRDTSTIDFDDCEQMSEDLRSDMQAHLRDVERQYEKQEKERSEVRVSEPSAAGGAELAISRYVRHFEKPLAWSMGKNTAEAFDGHVYWCVYEVNVTVENGKRREGTLCNYAIEVPEGRSLFAVMNAKVPFYDWARVRSKSYVLKDKDMPQQVDWRKSYGDPTDELDCLHEIDEFGRRIVANKDVTVCHIHLYRISNGF